MREVFNLQHGRMAISAMHFGSIRAALESRATPISLNDLHIAAHAGSESLVLVTNNLKDFGRAPGLLAENWPDSGYSDRTELLDP
jgi:predicted nucleic acid-binding protein